MNAVLKDHGRTEGRPTWGRGLVRLGSSLGAHHRDQGLEDERGPAREACGQSRDRRGADRDKRAHSMHE